jgi:hypothetical protein
LLDHHQDWKFIANQFARPNTSKHNLVLESIFVGGIDLRMLKLELRA